MEKEKFIVKAILSGFMVFALLLLVNWLPMPFAFMIYAWLWVGYCLLCEKIDRIEEDID